MKRQALSHPKMRRLMRALGLAVYEAAGILEVLWCSAEEHYHDGAFRGCDETDLADMVGWRGDAAQLVEALVQTGWLDRAEDGTLLVHDWAEHCADHIHARLARAGQSFADGRAPRITKLGRSERAQQSPPDPNGHSRRPMDAAESSTAHSGSRRRPAAAAESRRQPTAADGSARRTAAASGGQRRPAAAYPRPKTQDPRPYKRRRIGTSQQYGHPHPPYSPPFPAAAAADKHQDAC